MAFLANRARIALAAGGSIASLGAASYFLRGRKESTPGREGSPLKILANPDDANFDIVFVHGLNPFGQKEHHLKTWTAKNGVFWPNEFLPNAFEDCRIMLYRYNSNIAFKTGAAGISNHAESLLNALLEERKQSKYRPLIFICHSLGGLVVKQAFVSDKKMFEDITGSTKGIVFFATPHRGAKKESLASLGLVVAHIVRDIQLAPGHALAQSLGKDRKITDELALKFERKSKDLRFISVFESDKTPIGVIVEPESAILGFPESSEIQLDIERSHSNICRFESEEEWGYQRFIGFLKQMLKDISQTAGIDWRMRILKREDEEKGKHRPRTITFATNTDLEYHNCGMYKDSVELNQDIIERKEKVYGSQHSHTLFSRHQLGRALLNLGEYKKAEEILRDVLEKGEQAPGRKERDKLRAQGDLGHVLQILEDYTKSLEKTTEVVERSKEKLGEKDVDTMSSRHNLAWLHLQMGNYEDSETEFRSVLEDRKDKLGEGHIDTLATQGALAYVLRLQKKFPESKGLMEQELKFRMTTRGAGDNGTLECMRNLASLLEKMGHFGEAERYYQDALQAKRNLFGHDHPDTLDTEQNLRHVREEKGQKRGGETMRNDQREGE